MNSNIKRLENKTKILNATIELIKRIGIENITIRNVCEEANISIGTFYYYFKTKDDLLFYFVTEESYADSPLKTDEKDISGRIVELYMLLIKHYISLGKKFMDRFYSTSNRALSAYTRDVNGHFVSGSILERSEKEMKQALTLGVIKENTDIHMVCQDICTIIKGSVFEWCLCDGETDIQSIISRIISNYLSVYVK